MVWNVNEAATKQKALHQFTKHPLGYFRGTIESVKIENINNKPVWKIPVRTAHGVIEVLRWPITREALAACQPETKSGYEMREKVMHRVGFLKGSLQLIGGFGDDQEVDSASLDDVNAMFGTPMIGKICRIEVMVNEVNPKYRAAEFIKTEDLPDEHKPEPVRPDGSVQAFDNIARGAAGNFLPGQMGEVPTQPPAGFLEQAPPIDAYQPPQPTPDAQMPGY